ncbi:MAG: radical SAM protein, partial [Syntrophales bacterium]|nr:radical SAM protein [Syntrophales bacterium]
GTLLEGYAADLREAGLRRINVSLDSLDASKYSYITRGGDMRSVKRGIAEALRVGLFPVKINVVTMRGFNDDEIVDFAALTMEAPYEIRFIERMPLGLEGRDPYGNFVSGEEVLEKIRQRFVLEPLDGPGGKADGPAMRYRIEGGRGLIGLISPMSRHFCGHCNRLRLTADGNLRACLFSDGETPLKAALRSGCSDELLETLIRETIGRKPLKHDLERGTPKGGALSRHMHAIGG